MFSGTRSNGPQTNQNQHLNAPNGNASGGSRGDVAESNDQSPAPSATTQLIRPNGNSESPESIQGLQTDHDYSRIVHSDSKVILDTGYFSWIKIVFSLT